MRTLILLRHGEAEARSASGRDVDRVLTAAGRDGARVAGRALAQAGAAPLAVLVSASARTRETWAEIARALPAAPQAEVRLELYAADADTLLSEADATGVHAVLVVAHNPGLAELADELSGDGRVRAGGFPPSAFAWLQREEGAAGWRLVHLHRPGEGDAFAQPHPPREGVAP